jgi:hypothetical protein
VILGEFSERWNLYAKNITFACSLAMSTITWHSNHRNGPGGYMSGELKSENINTEKAPTQQSHHPAKITQLSHRIPLYSRKILVKELRFPTNYKDLQDPKTLTDCSSLLNATTTNLDRSLRQVGEFKIIMFLTHFIRERIPREVNNFHHWNYYLSIFFTWILSYPTIGHLIAPGLHLANPGVPLVRYVNGFYHQIA